MSPYYMPCTVLSTRDSWVNKINDHFPYGHKKEENGKNTEIKRSPSLK